MKIAIIYKKTIFLCFGERVQGKGDFFLVVLLLGSYLVLFVNSIV